jgi:hypothetical protein
VVQVVPEKKIFRLVGQFHKWLIGFFALAIFVYRIESHISGILRVSVEQAPKARADARIAETLGARGSAPGGVRGGAPGKF